MGKRMSALAAISVVQKAMRWRRRVAGAAQALSGAQGAGRR